MTRTRPSAPGIVAAAIVLATIVALVAIHLHRTGTGAQFAGFGAPHMSASQAGAALNAATLYQNADPGTVTIQSQVGSETITGTGFVADAQGHIVTASHVVFDYQRSARADAVYVSFASHDRVAAQIVGMDQFQDVAVLKVDPTQVKLHPLQFDDSDALLTGQQVAAIGAPFGYDGSISTGIISALGRDIPSLINEDSNIAGAIQFDAPINHGNSGGPLFDAAGHVIGIVQQIKSPSGESAGVAFAVPSRTVVRSFQQIVAHGAVQYAHLGVVTTTVTPEIAQAAHLASSTGAVVSAASGPAASAGIEGGAQSISVAGANVALGDEIVSIDGQQIASSDDVTRVASRLAVGQPVSVVFYRDGSRHTVSVTPDAKPI